MFWDDWNNNDILICAIFVALGIFLLWNIMLTIYIFLLRKSTNEKITNGGITTTRIEAPVWNQMYIPKIPRLQKVKSNPSTISSIPQSPSEWFGEGPDQMSDNIFF